MPRKGVPSLKLGLRPLQILSCLVKKVRQQFQTPRCFDEDGLRICFTTYAATATGGGWKRFWGCTSISDPSVGRFSVSMDSSSIPRIFVWSGPENSRSLYGIPEMNSVYMDVFNIAKSEDGTVSLSFTYVNQPINDWNKGNWKSGCIRRTPLECTETQKRSEVNPKDGFLKLEMIKVPDFAEWSSLYSELECRSVCFSNCSCIAYSYYKGIGCMFWTRSLIDIHKFSVGGADLYLRIAYSDLVNCLIFSLIFIKNNASYPAKQELLDWKKRFNIIEGICRVILWKLWREGKLSALADRVLSDPCFQDKIYRSIHVGLLCVQEFAKDRPAVPTIISMLHSEIVDLPAPKKPALGFDMDPLQWSQTICSNGITTTCIGGR
uniref:Apple domain-containing protein n=1 Tax=Salix viminalis TaxID=40686 RepID=A0A6N2LCT0_SALVM